MKSLLIARRVALLLMLGAVPVGAAEIATVRTVEGFADLADLTLASPIVAQATIAKMDKVGAGQSPGLAPRHTRFLIEAEVTALLRSPADVPGRIRYLWDAPLDARGKAPKLKKAAALLFLAPAGKPGEYRLVNAQGQVAATPAALANVRAVLADQRRPELQGLRITGVGTAFRVPGSLPGEAESQIFLTTADSRPISLVVLTRPGQARTYSIATGDVIDESSKPARPNSLLWYELACRLPRALPADSTASVDPDARDAVDDDYRFVLGQLGPCGRTLS